MAEVGLISTETIILLLCTCSTMSFLVVSPSFIDGLLWVPFPFSFSLLSSLFSLLSSLFTNSHSLFPQMQNKEYALRTETLLLSTFDYAWNTTSNGTRRPLDILHLIDSPTPTLTLTLTLSRFATSLLPCLPIQPQSHNFLSRVFSFNRSRPRLLQHPTAFTPQEDNALISTQHTHICGFILNDGSPCTTQPLQGRKKCHHHRGKTILPSIQTKPLLICGFISNDGSTCTTPPLQGRKRCLHHRGKTTLPSIQTKPLLICGFISNDGSTCTTPPLQGRKRCLHHRGKTTLPSIQTKPLLICGFISNDGSTCTTPPLQGRKRCLHHRGKTTLPSIQTKPLLICGFISNDGSTCTTPPLQGRKRCLHHKGRRIPASFHHLTNNYSPA
ncbi:hypothetical protein VNO78_32207 [Psophocarpus tetragonolobus]|uniref:Uncharacterized protein n=1 Tax=Psophocarpus tetragonolobus TaxID=3891 RepID=A0AAN9NZF3_PSOTE